MRFHARLWLFVFLVLIGLDGPGVDGADPGPKASDSQETGTPGLVVVPAALPTCLCTTPHDGDDRVVGATTLAPAASIAAPSAAVGLRSREVEWLNFRRLFADTVSYRTTAPPSRIA